jgi:uncharacterized protein Usg
LSDCFTAIAHHAKGIDMTTLSGLHEIKPFKLTTAEILYRMPDYPDLLQSFVWQKLDTAPEFPKLHKFLDFWDKNLEAPIHSVRVAGRDIIGLPSLRCVENNFVLH